ncbi:hypothetical protein SAMN05216330_1271, partial [Bradyrhizobium sp. Ghvi]
MVGTPFVPTPPGAPPRAGAVKDRRPPEAAAQRAVLDGSEHGGTSTSAGHERPSADPE